MYFLFNRNSLALTGVQDAVPEHPQPEFIVLKITKEQIAFHKQLDLQNVTHLEVALMYRNAGNISGALGYYRDGLISDLYYLLASGKAVTDNVVSVFEDPVSNAAGPVSSGSSALNRVTTPTPRSGNRATIFEVADRMWEAAGAPKDIPAVLQLRKAVMTQLETECGIKKTTSSTALGEWQKARLN